MRADDYYIGIAQVAKRLGVCENTVRKLEASGNVQSLCLIKFYAKQGGGDC